VARGKLLRNFGRLAEDFNRHQKNSVKTSSRDKILFAFFIWRQKLLVPALQLYHLQGLFYHTVQETVH
jgi:hypothetical protein